MVPILTMSTYKKTVCFNRCVTMNRVNLLWRVDVATKETLPSTCQMDMVSWLCRMVTATKGIGKMGSGMDGVSSFHRKVTVTEVNGKMVWCMVMVRSVMRMVAATTVDGSMVICMARVTVRTTSYVHTGHDKGRFISWNNSQNRADHSYGQWVVLFGKIWVMEVVVWPPYMSYRTYHSSTWPELYKSYNISYPNIMGGLIPFLKHCSQHF